MHFPYNGVLQACLEKFAVVMQHVSLIQVVEITAVNVLQINISMKYQAYAVSSVKT